MSAGDVAGNGSNSVEITAPLAKINTTLAHANGLMFTPITNWNSPADSNVTLTMVSDDLGNTGVGGAKSDTDTSTLTISEVNDAPTAVDDSLSSIAEDSGDRTIPFADLTNNDSKGPANESGQTLTITAVGSAVGGTVEISGTNVIFHPSADFNGTASFDYTVQDDGTTNGSPDFKTDIGAVTFTITEVNDAPIASDDPLSSVAEDSGDRTIALADLTSNDNKGADNESGQALTITSVSNAVGGTTEIVGANVVFHLAANFNGTASFDYVVQDNGTTDGSSDPKSDVGTVSFTVTEVNDAPTANDDALTAIDEDSGTRTIPFTTLLANDSTWPGERERTVTDDHRRRQCRRRHGRNCRQRRVIPPHGRL